MEAIALLYANIPPNLHAKSRFWMSRRTLTKIYESFTPTVVIDLTGSVTLFGLPVMIDDRMSTGAVSAETDYGAAQLN